MTGDHDMVRTGARVWLTSVLLAAPAFAQPSGNSGPPDPVAPQTQTYSDQTKVAGDREIVIDDAGHVDASAFGDFERPFLLAQWVCLPHTPALSGEALDRAFGELLASDSRRAACERDLKRLKDTAQGPVPAAGTAPVTVSGISSVWLTHSGSMTLSVAARDPGSGRECHRVDDLGRGRPKILDLSRVGCGNSNRVEFTVMSGAAGDVVAVFAMSFDLPTLLTAESGQRRTGVQAGCPDTAAFTIELDATGVESGRFRNPRRPLYLDPGNTRPPGVGANPYACARLEFVNRLVTRQLVVTFPDLDKNVHIDLLSIRGVTVQCSGTTCTVSVRVGPGSPVVFPLAPVYKSYAKEPAKALRADVVTFGVSFYDDDREPAFPRGYFSVVQARFLTERKTDGRWSSAATADLGWIPDLTEFDAKYTPPAGAVFLPSIRANDSRAQGNVRVSLKQNLGNRVTTDFEVRLKSGEYGGADPSVTATRFKVEVFTLAGGVFSAGRAAVAAPAESVALSEAGDSIGVRAGHFQLSHIFRKQVRDATLPALDPGTFRTDRDHATTVFQVMALPMTGSSTMDVFATYGRRRQARASFDPSLPVDQRPQPPEDPFEVTRQYWTLGTELSSAFLRRFRWTGALFSSSAKTTLPDSRENLRTATDTGRGTALFTTLSYTNFDADPSGGGAKRLVDWTFQARAGRGSAEKDDPDHPYRQEAYLGESQSFAPDLLFLGALVPALHLRDAERPALGRPFALTPGLGNKHYAGAVLNIPRLDILARLLRELKLPPDSFGDPAAAVRAHGYWLRNDLPGGRHLGWELDTAVTLEAPLGVKSSLTAAVFWPGAALKSAPGDIQQPHLLLSKRVWSIVATVNITIQ
jgi:hypothetical protein